MACKSCGAADLSASLGTCGRCTFIAVASAALFWAFFIVAEQQSAPRLIAWPLLGFAALLTLLLVGHVLGHLSHRFRH
jgi:ABC-type polysaccharide/polyol phosphate export permease